MKKLLFIGYFPLDNLDSAPKVRIHNLHKSFLEIIDTDFINGDRKERRIKLLKYILSGKIFKVSGIYVETSTTISMEIDILTFLIAKFFKIPIAIYIRDAYQLFESEHKQNLKQKISTLLWFVSIWFYKKTASTLLFPTEGLYKLFKGVKKYDLVPPAGTQVDFIPLPEKERGILYCGGISKIYGVENLISSLDIVYKKNSNIIFYFVCRKKELNNNILKMIEGKSWIKLMHTDFNEVIKIRDKIYLCVVPSAKDPYTEINLHIKILDYMSLSRPIVSTNGREVIKFFDENNFGLLCNPNIEDIAEKITNLLDNYDEAKKISELNYKNLTEKNLWSHRAKKILDVLNII